MRLRNVLAIGALLSGIALVGDVGVNTASADYRRVHSAYCHYFYDNVGTGLYNGAWISTNTARGIYCPAPSDSELAHHEVTTLNVHGYEPPSTSAWLFSKSESLITGFEAPSKLPSLYTAPPSFAALLIK